MDWNRVEGGWKQLTGKVKEQWGKLTDDDITQINGNREQLEGKIQGRYGKAKDDVKKDVEDCPHIGSSRRRLGNRASALARYDFPFHIWRASAGWTSA